MDSSLKAILLKEESKKALCSPLPYLILLVMDPLLTKLQSSVILSINNFYAGGYLHADDIRTVATSPESVEDKVTTVNMFVSENFFQLNIKKYEIVPFSHSNKSIQQPHCEVHMHGAVIQVRSEAKCLGHWWRSDLLASKSVSENIGKARQCFFLHGSIGAFQGDLNPPSTRSIIETCAVSVLLSVCENWILSIKCQKDLESFIGELAKRALKWPKHFSNMAAVVTLDLHSAKSYLLQSKLIFLRRQLIIDSMDSNRIGVVAMNIIVR